MTGFDERAVLARERARLRWQGSGSTDTMRIHAHLGALPLLRPSEGFVHRVMAATYSGAAGREPLDVVPTRAHGGLLTQTPRVTPSGSFGSKWNVPLAAVASLLLMVAANYVVAGPGAPRVNGLSGTVHADFNRIVDTLR